jgi:hypothetical protein
VLFNERINKISRFYNFISEKPHEFKGLKLFEQFPKFEQVSIEFESNSDLNWLNNGKS